MMLQLQNCSTLTLQGDICGRYFLRAGWPFRDRKWLHLLQSQYWCTGTHKGNTHLSISVLPYVAHSASNNKILITKILLLAIGCYRLAADV